MSQKALMQAIVADAQRARQRAAAYIRTTLKIACPQLPPVCHLGYNNDAGTSCTMGVPVCVTELVCVLLQRTTHNYTK